MLDNIPEGSKNALGSPYRREEKTEGMCPCTHNMFPCTACDPNCEFKSASPCVLPEYMCDGCNNCNE